MWNISLFNIVFSKHSILFCNRVLKAKRFWSTVSIKVIISRFKSWCSIHTYLPKAESKTCVTSRHALWEREKSLSLFNTTISPVICNLLSLSCFAAIPNEVTYGRLIIFHFYTRQNFPKFARIPKMHYDNVIVIIRPSISYVDRISQCKVSEDWK